MTPHFFYLKLHVAKSSAFMLAQVQADSLLAFQKASLNMNFFTYLKLTQDENSYPKM